MFAPDSDAIPRLVATLDPVLAGTIYKALGTASVGSAAVTAAMALQVQATPFGVRMPPRPVFNSQGQQVGTEEWPIGDVQVLSAQMSLVQRQRHSTSWPVGPAQVAIQGPSGAPAQAALPSVPRLPQGPVQLGNLGNLTVSEIEDPRASALLSPRTIRR